MKNEEKDLETSQAEETGKPQAGNVGQEPSSSGQVSEGETVLERELKEARSEAGKYRKALRDLEAKLKEYEDEKLSEKEKAEKRMEEALARAKELELQYRTAVLSYEIKLQAQKRGIIDPDVVLKLIDLEALKLEDGQVNGLEMELDKLQKEKPFLFSASSKSATNPNRTIPFSYEDLSKMSEAEINEKWDELIKSLKK